MSEGHLFARRRGRGHPVVFLGGCPTNWDALEPVARALSTTHACIELALPGYGASAALPEPYALDAAHEAVERALRAAGVETCALVGFSAGAYRALAIACRAKMRVTHVLSLAGLCAVSPEEAGGFRGFAAALRARQDLRGLAGPRFLSPGFAAAHPDAVRQVEAWLDAAPGAVVAAELDAFAAAEDLALALAGLAIPVVARVGAVDAAARPPKSEAIARSCPAGRLEIVEGAGHALVLEDEAGTIASLRRLLAR